MLDQCVSDDVTFFSVSIYLSHQGTKSFIRLTVNVNLMQLDFMVTLFYAHASYLSIITHAEQTGLPP